jgi:hypothetical protein
LHRLLRYMNVRMGIPVTLITQLITATVIFILFVVVCWICAVLVDRAQNRILKKIKRRI